MSESPSVPGPIFTDADLRRALDALDIIFQDEPHKVPEEEHEIIEGTLIARLQEKGITRALGVALIDQLIDAGVFKVDGTIVEMRIIMTLGGKELDNYWPIWRRLRLTASRWYTYLAEQRDPKKTTGRKKAGKGKTTRKRRARIPELLLALLDDQTKCNLSMTELASELKCSPSAVSRAFNHREHGRRIRDCYERFGKKPPNIKQI